jgi:hypothetical protein
MDDLQDMLATTASAAGLVVVVFGLRAAVHVGDDVGDVRVGTLTLEAETVVGLQEPAGAGEK